MAGFLDRIMHIGEDRNSSPLRPNQNPLFFPTAYPIINTGKPPIMNMSFNPMTIRPVGGTIVSPSSEILTKGVSPVIQKAATAAQNTTPAASPDGHTDSAWYNDPHYAVVSQLSRDEYVKPFDSGNGRTIIHETSKIVLDKLKARGYQITPDMYAKLEAIAVPASKAWVAERKAAGQDRSSIEYYLMLTDLALTHVGTPQAATDTTPAVTPSITAPQAEVSLPPEQTIPAQQEGSVIHIDNRTPDPATGKTYGTGSIKLISGVNNTTSADAFDKWASKNQDIFKRSSDPAAYQQLMKNMYTKWSSDLIQTYPQADLSPEAWEEFHGYKEYTKDHTGG